MEDKTSFYIYLVLIFKMNVLSLLTHCILFENFLKKKKNNANANLPSPPPPHKKKPNRKQKTKTKQKHADDDF